MRDGMSVLSLFQIKRLEKLFKFFRQSLYFSGIIIDVFLLL